GSLKLYRMAARMADLLGVAFRRRIYNRSRSSGSRVAAGCHYPSVTPAVRLGDAWRHGQPRYPRLRPSLQPPCNHATGRVRRADKALFPLRSKALAWRGLLRTGCTVVAVTVPTAPSPAARRMARHRAIRHATGSGRGRPAARRDRRALAPPPAARVRLDPCRCVAGGSGRPQPAGAAARARGLHRRWWLAAAAALGGRPVTG